MKHFAISICIVLAAILFAPTPAAAQTMPTAAGQPLSSQPASSQAAAPPSLNDDAIRFFYQQEVDSYKWPYARYSNFLANSMTDNFIADNAVIVTMPGKPPRATPNTQSRASITANSHGEYNMMQHANVAMNITAIRKDPDGKSAAVDYKTVARNITVGQPGGQQMSADSESDCTDTLVLSDAGAIQVKNTRCKTSIDVVTGITRDFGDR